MEKKEDILKFNIKKKFLEKLKEKKKKQRVKLKELKKYKEKDVSERNEKKIIIINILIYIKDIFFVFDF